MILNEKDAFDYLKLEESCLNAKLSKCFSKLSKGALASAFIRFRVFVKIDRSALLWFCGFVVSGRLKN